jgi:hypothetical protein
MNMVLLEYKNRCDVDYPIEPGGKWIAANSSQAGSDEKGREMTAIHSVVAGFMFYMFTVDRQPNRCNVNQNSELATATQVVATK